MFKLDPMLVEQFPFYEDMKHQAFSAVYYGSFPPIPPNSWTIVLRYVSESKEDIFMYSTVPHMSFVRYRYKETSLI